jgi:hypothetical protein
MASPSTFLLRHERIYRGERPTRRRRDRIRTCMGLFLSSDRFWLLSVLCSEGKAVLRPVACDRVRGARGRGQGTETVAKLGGFPPSGACVSQRLEAGARGAMMNCETGFLHSLGVWSVPVCRTVENPRGARHWRHFCAAHLYTVGSFDPDHDAVMRIGVGLQPTGLTRGEAPGGGPILSVGIKCQVRIRRPATSDRQFGSHAGQPARAPNGAEYARSVSPFRMLDVRRRPPMAHR